MNWHDWSLQNEKVTEVYLVDGSGQREATGNFQAEESFWGVDVNYQSGSDVEGK